ncbi:RNA-binding domain-containing protein [Lichtheimia hyalospora FSU 10163]|nr:RNA-binding domain-containing protein [Lichtheimia hyalospora FSU 10163]
MSNDSTPPSSTIYAGNLDQRVTDTMLHDLFATLGQVNNVKIITVNLAGVNYGFVDFADVGAAERALNEMNGHKFFDHEIKLNWAQQSKDNGSENFHVFVGDLAREINDDMLASAFSNFGTMTEAHVIWDNVSGNSKGYGFVAFRDKTDAEQAIATMNGEYLGSRPIRCNWATQKGQMATPPPLPGQRLPFQTVVNQAPSHVTNVYVGNLSPDTTDTDLTCLFEQHGTVQEVKLQSDRGYAFVKLDTHANAASAIVKLQGMMVNGRGLKLSWGKSRSQQQPPPTGHHMGGGHHHLYAGRAGYNARGFGHPMPSAENALADVTAPNSLASLDPHAGGTLAATSTPVNNQEEVYEYNGSGSIQI